VAPLEQRRTPDDVVDEPHVDAAPGRQGLEDVGRKIRRMNVECPLTRVRAIALVLPPALGGRVLRRLGGDGGCGVRCGPRSRWDGFRRW
jgi:hypothetical protein